MTYEDVKATGAEIVNDAFSGVPTEGWKEISRDQLREMKTDSFSKREFSRTAEEHDVANRWYNSSSAALERAEMGERVFSVTWADELAFAATKNHKA